MSCGCGCAGMNGSAGDCAGVPLDARPELALRDGLFARRHAAARGQTIGLFAVWPQETRDLIARIDPSMVTTDAAVTACATLPPDTRAAGVRFLAAWKVLAAEEVSTFGSARKYDEAEDWRASLGQWQDQLRGTCTVPGPRVSPEDPSTTMASSIKWISVAVLGASLVYGLRTVLK